MHDYTAYGLRIACAIALPELLEAPSDLEPDVSIRTSTIDRPSDLKPAGVALQWARAGDACLRYDGAGLYHITAGRQITIQPAPDADPRLVRLFLLGPALAILLHQRELLVLHASAVSIDGRVVAFAAEKGEGKSTFAAAMHSRGHPLVSDDLLPIDLHDPARLRVHPGFPQLKLMPEAAAQLSDEPAELPRLHPDFEKRAQAARREFPRDPLPLARIFILQTADADSVDVIPHQERFVELVRHSYLAQLLGMTGEAAVHFRQVVALAQHVPILRLCRRRQLATLSEAARLVEAELNHA